PFVFESSVDLHLGALPEAYGRIQGSDRIIMDGKIYIRRIIDPAAAAAHSRQYVLHTMGHIGQWLLKGGIRNQMPRGPGELKGLRNRLLEVKTEIRTGKLLYQLRGRIYGADARISAVHQHQAAAIIRR